MSEEVFQTLEPVAEQIEASPEQTEQTEEGGEEQAAAPAPARQAEPSMEDRIAKLLEERLGPVQSKLSKYDSELGQLRKLRSQFDKLNQNTNQPAPPQSWTALPSEQQQATKELVKHLVQELYGEQFSKWDQFASRTETEGQIRQTYSRAQQIAGADFEKLNPVMGSLFEEYKQRAEQGDEDAQDMVENIHTSAGLKALVYEARQKMAEGQEAKAATVERNRAERAKKATTAVNGSAPTSPQYSADNLPKNRAERMKVIDELLKNAGAE